MNKRTTSLLPMLLVAAGLTMGLVAPCPAQDEVTHRRGRIWENVRNDGWIGSLGAWDYLVSLPLGLFPGFKGYMHPVGNEFNAVNTYANANMHNFRSGVWISVRSMQSPGTPPTYTPTLTEYELFQSGLQGDASGMETTREPMKVDTNFVDRPGFDPLLPEELITGFWHTNSGITVTRRSYAWSFPQYRDFIIYDYVFKNTGEIVSNFTGTVVPNFPVQTLGEVYFVFHSGISVSTKSQINFHSELTAVQAGGFGWKEGSYHDKYHIDDGGTLCYSTNLNGGWAPTPFDPYPVKIGEPWKEKFGDELQSPAAFGWLALYASPTSGAPRPTPRADFLRVDSHKGGTFLGGPLDLEQFRPPQRSKRDFYTFLTTPDTQTALGNNGNRFNFYTYAYGPYRLAPGDSVRIILAEIAGVMDYNLVNAGDTAHFPAYSIAAVRKNAQAARNAVAWGLGRSANGIPLAADVPEPPPPPIVDALNASVGTDTAAIGISWKRNAETATILDGAGNVFYDGSTDLDGYRVYRSGDFQYVSDTELPAFRGAAWTLIADIPRNTEPGDYLYVDKGVTFGFRSAYYVSAYRRNPKPWTSANGTVIQNVGELESGDVNRTSPVSAAPGPVASFDIFVAPNPHVYGDSERSFGVDNPYGIEFRNLPERADIRIYTLMGDLVKTIHHGPDEAGNLYGSTLWRQTTDSGLLVAPGLYIYHVTSTQPGLSGEFTGKLMIIR